jgi:DNA-binding response OmpR family regulator
MRNKILVVDDDEGILDAVQVILQSAGYEVETSVNGGFLQRLQKISPDLILLDILLSGEDGRDICVVLKSQEETCHIPVILSSAHTSAGRVTDVYGAATFLPKPFDIDELLSTVAKYLPVD